MNDRSKTHLCLNPPPPLSPFPFFSHCIVLYLKKTRQMGRLLLLACALTPTSVGSFGLLPSSSLSSSPSCRWSAFHPSTVSATSSLSTASRIGARNRYRHHTSLASSHTNSQHHHRLNRIPTAAATAVAVASPGSRRRRFTKHSLALGSSLQDSENADSSEEVEDEDEDDGAPVVDTSSFPSPSPSDELPQNPGGAETAPQPPPLPLSPTGGDADDAEAKAEAALRKLSPSELAGMKSRLGLDDSLEGDELIVLSAVPILASKIRARAAAQEAEEVTLTPSQIKQLCGDCKFSYCLGSGITCWYVVVVCVSVFLGVVVVVVELKLLSSLFLCPSVVGLTRAWHHPRVCVPP